MGYHKKHIEKGVLGEVSKIREEFEELMDASEQNNPILEICELCDLVGAIEAYANRFNLKLSDIIKMKESTADAFRTGERN